LIFADSSLTLLAYKQNHKDQQKKRIIEATRPQSGASRQGKNKTWLRPEALEEWDYSPSPQPSPSEEEETVPLIPTLSPQGRGSLKGADSS